MKSNYDSSQAMKAAAERLLGRAISEKEWNNCRPKGSPPYGDLDLRACLERMKDASTIPLYRSNLSMGGFWYGGDYDIDAEGYVFLKEGGKLHRYRVSDEIFEIVDEFSALLSGIGKDRAASARTSARLRRRVLEFVRRRGLLGLAFLGFDAFLKGPSGHCMVAIGGSWTCPANLYFLPYLVEPADIEKLVFPNGFRLPSGLDEIQPSDVAERFFTIYREHIDEIIDAFLRFQEELGGFKFDPSEGAATYADRTSEFYKNAIATPDEFALEEDRLFGTSLDFPSLIAAIFLATVNMRKRGWRVKACANDNCDSLFLAQPENKVKRERLFCSTRCKNAQAYRNWAHKQRHDHGLRVQEDT
ncbi:MAG: CGNR zinc finger domain-containing protein [Firmicutes bacterium]|nr:CGNR zinc finger domain-containing protein [Bacillota bacterium]